MNTALDPVVSKKLDEFRRRRTRLLVGRGLAVGVATFLIAMVIVAAADYIWLMTDQVRWGLSLAAYAAAFIAVWLTSITRLRAIPGQEAIASQIESTEPALRENLLSAVELAVDDTKAIHDSPAFRSMLQGKVAKEMARIQVPSILPMRLVAKSMLAALCLIALVASLLVTGGDRVRQLAARAVLPGANIARVSRINVDVLEPTPKSLTVASEETVGVVAAISGGEVNEVVLETFTASGGSVRQTMWSRTDGEFAANLTIGEESVDYRILAGDAVTEKFRIESRPRPRVVAFQKTYQYPDYADMQSETVIEQSGDLIVIEGTTADLQLQLDQNVTTAELRIDPLDSDDVRTVPLFPMDDPSGDKNGKTLWSTQLLVREPAVYKVHLVSEETGFENKFAPRYEIRPVPDLIPRVGFVDQQEGTLLLPPNDILALKGMAEDDLPLEQLDQQISVNGREWITVPLSSTPVENDPRRVTSAWEWDLLQHRLKTGDQLLTKLVATDKKGNVGESVPMRIVVAGINFDPERHAIMEAKFSLYDDIKAFADQLDTQNESAKEAIEQLKQGGNSTSTAAIDLRELMVRQRDAASSLIDRIEEVTREMPAGADAEELELTGSVVARIGQDYANAAGSLLSQLSEDSKHRGKQVDSVRDYFKLSAGDAEAVAEHYQALATHNLTQSLVIDITTMLRQQEQIVNAQTQSWSRLLRLETIVINQLEEFEKVIKRQRSRLTDNHSKSLQNLVSWSGSLRTRLIDATESDEKLDQLTRLSTETLQHLRDRQRIEHFDGGIPNRVVHAWKELDKLAGRMHETIEATASIVEQEQSLAVQAADSSDSSTATARNDEMLLVAATIASQHERSLGQLATRRELTQARPDADSQYASDAGLTHRAAASVLARRAGEIIVEKPNAEDGELETVTVNASQALKEIAPAYRTLEAGHDVVTALRTVELLLAKERWDSQDVTARIDHPRQWDLIAQTWERASQRLREAGVDNKFPGQLDEIRWSESAREASRKITERRWRNEAHVSASSDLQQLRDRLQALSADLNPTMEDARAVIARYAPSIPQLARQAAEQVRELEQQTKALAESKAAPQPEQEQTEQAKTVELAELRQQQDAVNEQVSDLLDALVAEANNQDLSDEQQREVARDADDSIAMVREPATEMNQALQQAEQAPNAAEQAQQLEVAATEQQQTAEALDLVAEHFERLQNGLEVADSREQLRQAERDMGLARQMEQQYSPASELAEMAQQTPEDLLQELEAELARNPLMQEALSEIAQDTLTEARNSLEYAANDEQQLQRANERSDEQFRQQKQQLAEDLRNLAQDASQLSNELVREATDAAQRGRTAEAATSLQQARDALNQAASRAAQANADQLLEDLSDTAQQVQQQVAKATEALAQAKQETARGKNEEVHDSDRSRENQKKSSEQSRDRFIDQQKRSAVSQRRQAEEAVRREERSLDQAKKNLESANKRLAEAERKAAEKPDDQGRQNTVNYEKQRLAGNEAEVAREQSDLARAKESLDQARGEEDRANRTPRPSLNAPNPSTELADQYTEAANKEAARLQEASKKLAEAADFGESLAPSANELANSSRRQEGITEDVTEVAQNLERAARHEQRLNNAAAAEQIQSSAEAVQNVASNESSQAQQQLQAAAESAQAAAENNPTQPQSGDNRPSLNAQAAAANTEQAIAAQANDLSEILAPMEAAAQQQAEGSPQSGESSQSQAGSPEGQLASSENANASQDRTPGQQQSGSPQQSPSGSQPNSQTPNSQTGSQQASSAQPNSSTGSPTSAEVARAQELARTLDELDRMQAAAAAQGSSQDGQPSSPQPSTAQLFAQATRAQQASLASQRTQSKQQAMQAISEGSPSQDGTPPDSGTTDPFNVLAVNRNEQADWGKLRGQAAEDVTAAKGEKVSEEYRSSVEAYFRVLAERARRK